MERNELRQRMAHFWSARVDRHSVVGLRLTMSLVMLGLAIWLFSGLLEEVLDNEWLVRWDHVVSGWFHAHATAAGLAAFSAITTLGSAGAFAVIVLAAIWLWRSGHPHLLTAWVGTNLGGEAVQLILKTFVHRTRPEYAAAYLHGHSYSFPSGHSMQSTITYVALVFIGTRANDWWRRHHRPLLACAIGLVLLIAFSRVYLGVHYPSDVVAGMVAGTAWLSATLVLLDLVATRRAPGSPADAPAPRAP